MSVGFAIVVGGTRGLGRVVVSRFVERNIDVVIVSRRPSEEFSGNLKITHIALDLHSLRKGAALDLRALPSTGLRYLVFAQRYRGVEDDWDGEIEVGLTASKILIEQLSGTFCIDGDCAIVFASSVYAERVGGSQPVSYHVVKAGLNSMCRYYAWSLGKSGIRVNSVMPLTYIKDETSAYFDGQPAIHDLYRRFVPLGRLGEANDSADAIDFLCSEKASFITGQSLFIDGGVSVVWPEETAKTLSDFSRK